MLAIISLLLSEFGDDSILFDKGLPLNVQAAFAHESFNPI